MSDTTTPYDFVSPGGVIVPDTSDILTTVQGEWIGVFGAGLNTDTRTPQGVMISAEVAARTGVVQNNAAVANQINPNQAEGLFLDAICALSGLVREGDTFSLAEGVLLAGVQNSPIPEFTQLKSPNGDVFQSVAAVTLDPVTGQATVNFQAIVAGPVPVPAGSWTIFSDILGLETATNPAVGVPGTAEQSDTSLRQQRVQTLFLQAISLVGASLSAVRSLPGVIGAESLENTGAAATIEGVAMVANSVWFVVDGGTPADIAAALLNNKSGGAAWNGAQSLTIIEPNSGQPYLVKWDVPTLIPLVVQVTCKQGTFTGDVPSSVTKAVLDFASNNVQPANPSDIPVAGFVVSQSASPFEIAAGILQECPGLYIQQVAISLASTVNYQPAEIVMAIFQKATVGSGGVTVVLNT